MAEYTKLIKDLEELAEWAEANIYEVPIQLPDTMRDAVEALKNDVCGEIIENFQDADVAPVKHGWWEWFEEWSPSTPDHSAECDDCGWKCSECKTALEDMVNGYYDDPYYAPPLNYCPNCGARMDGGKGNG